MKKSKWDKQFMILGEWLMAKGYKVECYTSAEDRLEFDSKVVHIDSRQHAENRFYTLVHECGHLLIAGSLKQFQKDHPVYASSCDSRQQRSRAYQVSLVAEEIEAWKRGRRLANRLNLHINDKKFDKVMTSCVMTYIADAAAIAG
jgi:hypothetical protein